MPISTLHNDIYYYVRANSPVSTTELYVNIPQPEKDINAFVREAIRSGWFTYDEHWDLEFVGVKHV